MVATYCQDVVAEREKKDRNEFLCCFRNFMMKGLPMAAFILWLQGCVACEHFFSALVKTHLILNAEKK